MNSEMAYLLSFLLLFLKQTLKKRENNNNNKKLLQRQANTAKKTHLFRVKRSINADRLAQLVEYWTTVQEVVGLNPGPTNTQGSKRVGHGVPSVVV